MNSTSIAKLDGPELADFLESKVALMPDELERRALKLFVLIQNAPGIANQIASASNELIAARLSLDAHKMGLASARVCAIPSAIDTAFDALISELRKPSVTPPSAPYKTGVH